MNRYVYDELTESETIMLDQAMATVSLIHEVAELRARNRELEQDSLKRMRDTQAQLSHNNAFIGNLISGLLDSAEKRIK